MSEQSFRLLTVLGDIDERYVDMNSIRESSRPRKIAVWLGAVAAVAACAALLFLGIGSTDGESALPMVSPETEHPPQEDITSSRVIFVNALGCYEEGPQIGEAFVEFANLLRDEAAREETVLADISLMDENGPVLHSEEVYKELDRLKSLGYEVYVYEEHGTDYWGAPRDVTHIAARMTWTQLENFAVGDSFAYYICPHYFSVPLEEYTLY